MEPDRNGEKRMPTGGRPSAAAFDTIVQFIQRYEGAVQGIGESVSELRVDLATLKTKFEHIERQLSALISREDTQSNRRFQAVMSIVPWLIALGGLLVAVFK